MFSAKVIEAKTPQAVIGFEGEDTRIDARYVASLSPSMYTHLNTLIRRLLKDDRVKMDPSRSLYSQDTSDRHG
jgi:hypothetical protein